VARGEEAVSRRGEVDNEYFLVVFLYPFLSRLWTRKVGTV
jgi:hypothetical protein